MMDGSVGQGRTVRLITLKKNLHAAGSLSRLPRKLTSRIAGPLRSLATERHNAMRSGRGNEQERN